MSQPRKGLRSRSGCMTCRRARVRCDEKHPICERCNRLELDCSYQPFVSRKERERRHREARERTIPIQIIPNVVASIPHPTPADVNEFLHAVEDEVFPDMWNMHEWTTSMGHGFVLPEGSFNLEKFDGLAPGNKDTYTTSPSSPFQPLRALDLVGRDNVVFQDDYYAQGCVTLHFPNLRHPSPLKLSPSEKRAVEHYEKTLSLKFTTKNPTWSTQQIYICLGAQDPLIMHLLLAISFRDLFFKDKDNELHDLAQKHFRAGIGRLLTAISEEELPHHLSIMAAFWFLYMLGSSQIHAGIGTMMLLSRVVRDYVQKHVTGLLDLDPLNKRHANAPLPFHLRDQSLIARVTVWMFYADVGFCFCYRGGDLARYLCTDTKNISKIVDMGRAVLALNFNQDYPPDQAADDTQNLEVLDLLWKSAIMCQLVNDLDQNIPSDEIEQQFCELEQTYSYIFKLAAIDMETRPRFLINADWILSYFYAIRIYHFRYTTQNGDRNARPKVIKRALKSLLDIAQRIFAQGDEEHYERLHWPLFMAGIETTDTIHREWILEKFSSGKFKTVLEKVSKIQHLSGTRVHMSLVREMCSKEGDAPRVTFLGF
ncbi:uncharacterized protein EAE97_004721 [Botrytis byssoidea]|uniref:Zn(2)-C6 fungal-type domain-containing protein n=1 Tax=Botrytis byssoidea TaxID=139641 RepID=A0A9P5M610_9HELO|nr:uncharacterized protein EAE97_004721 [Botrytis byssoidea]KAF7945683.1 hypothetical protein EAE97_004721 [Botrytis byssoidea]